ncbi:hypothetical protein C8A00DRAFT_31407 [Chaetomidium leptoderma]|uniref:N-acetylglucosaminylphosphatidylinositol deacetylase n=1 Tax=Chaetomidium leptoderma TaxID=669021 RepID=A0AAN6VQ44_9PEZI|nr:hypothetical protein C8A00DRAFT_31407 [Chaetomidium leptoderma]
MLRFAANPAQIFGRIPRRAWRWTFRVTIIALLVPVLLQWLLAYVVGSDARILPPQLLAAKSLLIVTAHPDDECLFFSPSILGVLDRNKEITGALLVMSTGNNYGLGDRRTQELQESCNALGIHPKRCIALNHPELQDNPDIWWNTDLIETIVREHVSKWKVDAIVTFDEGGVSGHLNHKAVSAAVSHYAAANPEAPVAFTLTTTSLLRKYTLLGDLPLTALPFLWRIVSALSYPATTADSRDSGLALVANTWGRYLKTRHAFAQHPSQYTWDRHLYMVLSRYVWFNDLRRVERLAQSSIPQAQAAQQ